MFRSLTRDRAFWKAALAFAVGVAACSSVAEWEEVPGTLELYADPLPPVAGQPLVLGVRAENVGPVEVFQGDVRLATFANTDLTARRDFEVVARSDEQPYAAAVAYDRQRLVVYAAPFTSPPDVPDAGPEVPDGGPLLQESCPGVIDLAAPECSSSGGAAISVRVWNNTPNPVSVYERPPSPTEPGQCLLDIAALAAPGAIAQFTSTEGAVLRVLDDTTIQVVREVRLPAGSACDLVLAP